MRYDPSLLSTTRDLRLDWLRGLCLIKMVLEHLLPTPLMEAGRWIGYVTAAEGFFFISGAVLGIVYRRRVETLGLASCSRALVERSLQLYVANLAFVFLFLSLELSKTLPLDLFGTQGGTTIHWARVFSLDQPYYLHVLPRYVIFLLLAPAALWMLRRGWTPALVLITASFHGTYWFVGPAVHLPWIETSAAHFPTASWQLLFIGGMVVGWHHEHLARGYRRWSRSWIFRSLLVALFVGFVLMRQSNIRDWTPIVPYLDRTQLGYLRLVNLTIAFTFFFWVVDQFWKPIHRWTSWFVLPIGQSALYVFLLHIPIAFGLAYGLGPILLPHVPTSGLPWARTALDLCVLAVIWFMVRRRFLFSLVPR